MGPATAVLMRRAHSPQVTDLAITATGTLIEDMTTHAWNRDGQISPNRFVFPFQRLNVEAGGSLTPRTQTGSVVRRGAMSADQNLILLGGDFTNPKLAAIHALVRRNQVATTGALQGDYHECNFESSVLGYLSGYGDVTLDGSGEGNWSYSINVGDGGRYAFLVLLR